jgi:hypothetical protein
MPEPFPSIKDGDALTPAHLNMIYRELDRWRKLSGSGLIGLDNIDGKEPPMIMDWRTSDVVPADSGSGFTAGSRSSPTSATVTLLSPSRRSWPDGDQWAHGHGIQHVHDGHSGKQDDLADVLWGDIMWSRSTVDCSYD